MIYFFCPRLGVGGIQTVFKIVSNEFTKKKFDFGLIAFEESYLLRYFNCNYKNFKFINLNNFENEKSEINELDTIIVTYWSDILNSLGKINPKIFYWNVSNHSLMDSNKFFKKISINYLNKRCINYLIENHGLSFMDDGPAAWFKKDLDIDIINSNLFLPVPIEKKYISKVNQFKKEFQVSYIGRSVKWKLFPVLKIIDCIINLRNKGHKISFNIVTDNSKRTINFIHEHSKKHEFINYYENLTDLELQNFLLVKSDLNIGMGLSILESSSLAIPSLLINPSNGIIVDDYVFKWVHKIKNFNLGEFNTKDKLNYITLEEAFSELSTKEKYEIISNKCLDYCINNHDPEEISFKLFCSANITNVRFTELRKFVFTYSKTREILNRIKKTFYSGK